MSLAIDVDLVTGILLADGQHDLLDASLKLDSHQYLWSRFVHTSVRRQLADIDLLPGAERP